MEDDFDDRIVRIFRPGDAGPVLTDELVAEAERDLGVRLPTDLVTLLRVQNGGYVGGDFAACPTARPTSWAEDHVAVDEIAGIGSSGVLSLLESPVLNAEWGQPAELLLLSGDGHWWIALDYRECSDGAEPPVVFYENDSEGNSDELRLASSFREFICRLRPEPEDDVSLAPGQVKRV